MKHRSGSGDICQSYMYMPELKSVVQVVRRNSSLELPVGHDLFHLTFKPEQYAETHRTARGKFQNSAAYETLSGNLENHRQIRGKRAQNDDHAESWPQCERDGHKRLAAWSHGRPSWSQSERTLSAPEIQQTQCQMKMMGKTTCSDSLHWKKWTDLQHLERLQHQKCCTKWPSGSRSTDACMLFLRSSAASPASKCHSDMQSWSVQCWLRFGRGTQRMQIPFSTLKIRAVVKRSVDFQS